MNQIKYLVSALMLLLVAVVLIAFVDRVVSTPKTVQAELPAAAAPAEAKPESPLMAKGKTIFQQNCQSCHAINKNLTGPALAGLTERGPWTERENLYKWVKNPAAFLPTTPYTIALQKQYNGQIMPGFPQLSNEDIDAVIEYVTAG